MAYQFAGYFVATTLPKPGSLPRSAVWREISRPFQGVGVLLPHLIGKAVECDQIRSLAKEVGATEGTTWLFLRYDCWAGRIDFVYGLGVAAGAPFGPIEESEDGFVEAAYTRIMGLFGVNKESALNFPAFERGFWGEG